MPQAVETSRPLIERPAPARPSTLPAELLASAATATRLAQVLTNLLNNAAKYTDDGGRDPSVERPRQGRRRDPRARHRRRHPAEMLARVFDLFTQVDRSLDRSQGGLGIGLTLVRRLVEMHGGTRRGPQRRPRPRQRVRNLSPLRRTNQPIPRWA